MSDRGHEIDALRLTVEALVREKDEAVAIVSVPDAMAVRALTAEDRVGQLAADCAQFCGDNERLIKATGTETVEDALNRIDMLFAEIAEAREACPAVRMQRFFDAPILTLVQEEIRQLFWMQSRAEQAESRADQLAVENERLTSGATNRLTPLGEVCSHGSLKRQCHECELEAEVERLTGERDEWKRLSEQDHELHGGTVEERDHARAALRMVEWVIAPTGWIVCPWCQGYSDEGHHRTCPRQAALAATREGA